MSAADLPLIALKGATMLRVRAIPGASRDEITGLHTDDAGEVFLKLKVRARPDKGAANTAIIQLLSRELNVPKSEITLHAGDTNRSKTFILALAPEEASARLMTILA